MPETADVVVIGGGVIGSACAYWLTRMRPGLRVTVLERDTTYARAATALSVASVRQQFSSAVNVAISRFGIDFIRNFAERLGHPAGDLGLRENGYLFVTASPDNAATMAELASMQNALGAATAVLTPEAILARFPWMTVDDLVAGSFGTRDEGWFDNMGLLHGFRDAARAQGAVFRRGEAARIDLAGGRATAVGLAGGGRIDAGAVVNAAGTRAAALMREAGLDLPVEPRKRTVFVIDAPNARHPDAPLLIDRGYYLRPEQGHWITATVPDDDGPCDVDDFEPDLHLFEEAIWERLYARARGFDAVKVIRHWVGHYDYNRLDQNAVLGPWPGTSGLHVASGFSGHGLQQAPAIGRGLAEQVLTGAWQTLDLSPLGVDRILAGRPLLERAVV